MSNYGVASPALFSVEEKRAVIWKRGDETVDPVEPDNGWRENPKGTCRDDRVCRVRYIGLSMRSECCFNDRCVYKGQKVKDLCPKKCGRCQSE